MTTIPAPASNLDRFFATVRRSPVRRSPNGRVGGVSSGLAEQYGLSVKVVRIVTILLAIFGAGVTLYLLAWLLLPDHTGSIHLERAIRHGHAGSLALLAVTVLSMIPDAHVHDHGHDVGGSFFLPVALVIAAIVFAKSRGRRHAARRGDGPQDVLHH